MILALFELSKKDATLAKKKKTVRFVVFNDPPLPYPAPSPPPWQFIPNLLTKPHAIDMAVNQAHVLY